MLNLAALQQHCSHEELGAVQYLMDNAAYQLFLPNKAQAEFTKAIGTLTPEKHIYLATSGNGTGKTTITVNIPCNIIYPTKNVWANIEDVETGEQYSRFFDYPLFNNYPREWPKKAWYISNNDSIKNSIDEFLK